VPYREYYGGCYWWELRGAPGGSITYDLSGYVSEWTQGVENWDSALGSLMEFNSIGSPYGQTHLRWEGQAPVYYYCCDNCSACYYIDPPWCTHTQLTQAAVYFDYLKYAAKTEVRKIAASAHEWGHNLNLGDLWGRYFCAKPPRIMGGEGPDGVGCITGPSCPEQAAVIDYYMLIPWWHDRDGDCWDNDDEDFIGTDDWDDCPDNSSDDAWPPDINKDTVVNVMDMLLFKPVLPGPYNRRYDLNTDGEVNVLDMLLYKPLLDSICTNP
jgi:hypothetical protein